MRFAVARQQGLDEEQVGQIDDDHAESALPQRSKAALELADAFLLGGGPPSPDAIARLRAEFTDAELAELGIGLAVFHGVSKMLIALGCEPDDMEVTEVATPGTRPPGS